MKATRPYVLSFQMVFFQPTYFPIMNSSRILLKRKHMSVALLSNIFITSIFSNVYILPQTASWGNSSLSSNEANIDFKVPLHGRSLALGRNS